MYCTRHQEFVLTEAGSKVLFCPPPPSVIERSPLLTTTFIASVDLCRAVIICANTELQSSNSNPLSKHSSFNLSLSLKSFIGASATGKIREQSSDKVPRGT